MYSPGTTVYLQNNTGALVPKHVRYVKKYHSTLVLYLIMDFLITVNIQWKQITQFFGTFFTFNFGTKQRNVEMIAITSGSL